MQQKEYNDIIQDINNNKFISGASQEDKVKIDVGKQVGPNYSEEIETSVQSKMD